MTLSRATKLAVFANLHVKDASKVYFVSRLDNGGYELRCMRFSDGGTHSTQWDRPVTGEALREIEQRHDKVAA